MGQLELFDPSEGGTLRIARFGLAAVGEYREKIIRVLGGQCVNCGQREISVLDVDHVFNDGAKDRKESGRTYCKMYRRCLHDSIYRSRLQVLCAPCHAWKTRTGHIPPPECVSGAELILPDAADSLRDFLVAFARQRGCDQRTGARLIVEAAGKISELVDYICDMTLLGIENEDMRIIRQVLSLGQS